MKRLVHRNVVKVVAAFTTLSESNGYASLRFPSKNILENNYSTNTHIQIESWHLTFFKSTAKEEICRVESNGQERSHATP